MIHSAFPATTATADLVRPSDVASRPNAVAFSGVTHRYGATTALDDVSLEIGVGETVALLGPNGAGKSTAINLMLGLLEPTAGTVRTLGLEAAAAVASGRIGSMLQAAGLPANVLVGELVEFARALYPRPLPLDDVLERAGLMSLRRRRTEGLSGGEMQRVRFALAIAGDPDLVFLDEPTVAMDVESRRAFWGDMRRFAAEGRTVLFATHYLDEADQVADRIVVLDHGRIVADGTSASIKAGVADRRVRFTLRGTAPADGILAALDGVDDVQVTGTDVVLTTRDADATVRALVAGSIAFENIEVSGASLETAFLALTGNGASH